MGATFKGKNLLQGSYLYRIKVVARLHDSKPRFESFQCYNLSIDRELDISCDMV